MTTSTATATDALDALRRLTGRPDAQFHDGQLEAITALVDDHRRALVVQRTGWGKSAVYFVATSLLRARGTGPTLLVSPLIALMRDQVAAAARAGVRAVSISSANAHEWDDVRARLDADDVDVLLVSPERLTNPRFRDEQLPELRRRIGLLVVDEAHCISDWGHDFRPDYRRLADLIDSMPDGVPVLATTATANQRVVTDVEEQLGASGSGAPGDSDVLTLRGSLARTSLRLGSLRLPSSKERLGWLVSHLAELPGSGIVYTLTVSAAEDLARLLTEAGHEVAAYTGRTDPDERVRLEQALKDDQLKALVATSALGMGFDKPNLGFVVHLGAPSSPVAYYQQVGRAGRATESADVLLLPGPEDADIWRYFATASMPTQAKVDAVLGALGSTPTSVAALEAQVDIRRTPLELLLKVLDVDGAVRRVQGGWVSTGEPWVYDADRYERIAQAREAEQEAMLEYQAGRTCRMELLQRQLDDPTAAPCGRCDVCAGPWYPTSTDGEAVARATQSLDRVGVPVDPRAQWPSGVGRLGVDVSGRIPPAERPETGRVVARLTDLGWGGTLRELFATGAPDVAVSEALLGACARALRDWPWAERPVAVVAVPSAARPTLVASVAEGLARLGRLPLLPPLQLAPGAPQATQGGNSAFRLAGVWGRFVVSDDLRQALAGLSGPVLLVDDLVDSRWTMAVASRELRLAGADAVLPFALGSVG
ncbi:ATP-dependent DNA helicase RecQ [Aeromicrobium sp. SORGH_AS981]|uniref:RecQ family ATP-dependent DNA helicase n=1 Tax=Aeromicrobium sp. SORGH_AS_0981 TaxID=3041802 RepID=UPI002857051C|nr:DEAD/DEAH box helicase [Aeromicrobium sp. SORGH_AS_0981]MDR6119071.1 ATP-dependent DNA helicase RecQ [Aeromicrobium sp. SORGH_AS_0981]